MSRIPVVLIAGGALSLSACATARMHSAAELNLVASGCGLALGELIQDEEEKRLLILLRDAPTPAERTCVHKFARRNHLRPVFIEGVEFAE